jgi:hypothetical protein
LHHRQIDWLLALQDACCVGAHLTIRFRQAGQQSSAKGLVQTRRTG